MTQDHTASKPKRGDAAHIFLRRAARVAILVPLMSWFTSDVIKQPAAGLPSSFALFSILVFANLGGPKLARLRANVMIVLVGLVALIAGAVTGASVWVAVPATFMAIFAISYSAVLRGYFAASTNAVIVPWVLGATSGTGVTNLPAECVGWLVGGTLACVAASLLWPYYEQDRLKSKLADVLDASASMVDQRWSGSGYSDEGMAALDASIAKLQSVYDGVLSRPGSGAPRERSLMLAVDEANRLRTALWSDQQAPQEVRECDERLANVTATALRQAAAALRGEGQAPQAEVINAARAAHQKQLADWVGSQAAASQVVNVYPSVASSFDIRLASLTAELVVLDVHHAVQDDSCEPAGGTQTAVTIDGKPLLDLQHRATVKQRISGQWSWSSPWFRTALRTATAIAITVLIVRVTKLDYALWVSLGAMAALKFDASGTRRSGSQIALGTFGGFIVGAAIIALVGDRPGIYWVLLPISVFLAAYTPGKTSLAVGQGAFTVFLITMIAISHPGSYSAGEMRVIDVALGVSVSLIVSALMWPHGAAAMVRRKIAEGADQAGSFLVSAFELLTRGEAAAAQNEQTRRDAARAVAQAVETLDLAISQRGPGLEDAWEWMLANNTSAHLMYTGGVVTSMSTANPLPAGCQASRDELIVASERANTDFTRAVAQMAAADDAGHASPLGEQDRIKLWAATNLELAHHTPEGVAGLATAVDRDTQALLAKAPQRQTSELGRETIALAFAAGWAIRANQLALRMAVLSDASK